MCFHLTACAGPFEVRSTSKYTKRFTLCSQGGLERQTGVLGPSSRTGVSLLGKNEVLLLEACRAPFSLQLRSACGLYPNFYKTLAILLQKNGFF